MHTHIHTHTTHTHRIGRRNEDKRVENFLINLDVIFV